MTLESLPQTKSPIRWLLPTLVATISAYIAWPYFSMWQLYSALQSKNADALSGQIDFPSLRTSLKDQINAFVMAKMADNQEIQGNILAGLTVAVLPKVVDSMVDAYVTPAGVTQLFKADAFNSESQSSKSQTSASELDPSKTIKFAFFSNPSQFLLKTENVDFVFRLQDWTWKLTEVKLTESALAQMEAREEAPESDMEAREEAPESDQVVEQQTDTPLTTEQNSPSLAKSQLVQAKDGYANLRSQPSTEVNSLRQIPNGTTVSILDQETNNAKQLWYKVEVNGQVGWIYSELLSNHP